MSFVDCCQTFLVSRQSTSRGRHGRSGIDLLGNVQGMGQPAGKHPPGQLTEGECPATEVLHFRNPKGHFAGTCGTVHIHLIKILLKIINVISSCSSTVLISAVLVYYTANHEATVNPTNPG